MYIQEGKDQAVLQILKLVSKTSQSFMVSTGFYQNFQRLIQVLGVLEDSTPIF